MDLAFVLDCEETYLQERLLRRGRVDDNINAIATRIQFYKQHTLPAIKHFDDQGKLYVVCDSSILNVQLFNVVLLKVVVGPNLGPAHSRFFYEE